MQSTCPSPIVVPLDIRSLTIVRGSPDWSIEPSCSTALSVIAWPLGLVVGVMAVLNSRLDDAGKELFQVLQHRGFYRRYALAGTGPTVPRKKTRKMVSFRNDSPIVEAGRDTDWNTSDFNTPARHRTRSARRARQAEWTRWAVPYG